MYMLQKMEGSFVVNALFLFVLHWKAPLIYRSSSFFKDQNLFLLVEMFSAATTLVGNILAILGTMDGNVDSIGIAFAVVNMSFGVLFFYGYSMDIRKTKYTVAPELRPDGELASSRSQSMIKAVSRSVAKMEKDWKGNCAAIVASKDGSNERNQMKLELVLVRSKLENEVRDALSEMEEEMKGLKQDIRRCTIDLEEVRSLDMVTPHDVKMLADAVEKKEVTEKTHLRVFGEYTKLLNKIEQDMKEIFVDDDVSVLPAVTIESILTKDNLTIMATLSKKSMESGSLALARGLEEGGPGYGVGEMGVGK